MTRFQNIYLFIALLSLLAATIGVACLGVAALLEAVQGENYYVYRCYEVNCELQPQP